MATNTTKYNMSIPTEEYKRLQDLAENDGTTVAAMLRRATRLFLFVRSIKEDPNAHLYVERNGERQEIVVDLI